MDARDARGWRLGGGVTYCSLAAARLGARVLAVIGVDADAAQAAELDLLRAAGVEIELVRLRRGPVFESHNTAAGRLLVARQASDRLSARAVPAHWRAAPAVLLAPVAGELGEEWRDVPAREALVGLSWQGCFRRLMTDRPVEHLQLRPKPLLERADIAVVSAEDAVGGGAPLADLLPRVGQQLAVTDGESGAVHVERLRDTIDGGSPFRVRAVPAIPVPMASDPTGAGDVFLAAWLAALVACAGAGVPRPAWVPLAVASAAASGAVEARSLDALPGLAALRPRLLRPPNDGT